MSLKISALITIYCLMSTISYAMSVPAPAPPAPTPLAETVDQELYELVKNSLTEPNATLPTLLATTVSTLVDTHLPSLNSDFYPTLHSALMAPFALISHLIRDVLKFYEHKSMTQLFSISTLRSAVVGAPQTLTKYWARLMDMETECMYRTICDLSAFLSPRIPFWANQLLGVYFTSNSVDNAYYRAVTNGMINRNCVNYYGQCSLSTTTTS